MKDYTDRVPGLLFYYIHVVFFCGRRQRVTVTKAAVLGVLFRNTITIVLLHTVHKIIIL